MNKDTTYEEKYYINDTGILYLEEIVCGKSWGHHFYYGDRWNTCAVCKIENLNEITKDEFDAILFTEKL
jgi:hypothetical protein